MTAPPRTPPTTPPTTPQSPSTRADRLVAAAREAGMVRAYQTDPDVVALRVERIRGWSSRLIWVGIILGLAFTMTNVQHFAAQGAEPGSLPWLTAWLLDPMVSLVLIGVLLAEQVTARYQVPMGRWPRIAKWGALAATYAMNTWQAWAAGNVALIVLHSVPPLMVFVAVEAFPVLRDRLTEAVLAAERDAHRRRSLDPDPAVTVETSRQGRSIDGATIDRGSIDSESVDADPVDRQHDRGADRSIGGQQPRSGDSIPPGQVMYRPEWSRGRSRADQTPADGVVARSIAARSTGRSVEGSADRGDRSRSIEDLRSELGAAIEMGSIDATAPSAEQIRRVLRVSPNRARKLRDELRDMDTAYNLDDHTRS